MTTNIAGPAYAGPALVPDVDRLTNTVVQLAADEFTGRRVGTSGSAAARAWLATQLHAAGARVSTSEFSAKARDVYATPVLAVDDGSGRQHLVHRRDFAEHLASADLAEPVEAVLGHASDADVTGRWVLAPAFTVEAAVTAAAARAVGLLVPRGTDDAGWMPKLIAGPATCPLPALSLRADLHQRWSGLVADGPVRVTASVPLSTVDVIGVNLYGDFSDAAKGWPSVLLTAHYDGVGDDPGVRLPSAADNASGVAVVLEAARLVAPLLPSGARLQVALLDAEEVGARGSEHHALTLPPGTSVINVDGAADMNEAASVEAAGPALPVLEALDAAGRLTGVPLRAGAMASDNRRYGAAGLPAVGIGMGLPGYQTPAETPDRVQPATLIAATRLVAHTVLHLVGDRT
ncbi:hypothetical protein HDA40_001780 [Hamadaea flava]|uniref:M28 family metallopeptidase n=1 Tax=Hamadaea flava TaxID=1742688 RepID=A0ABV8LNV9_9ACTN|nr:M28 family peptidase [Hamadaea flava]MCP2323273.1 hypothetical protein [Hamadaea flava]